MGNYPIGDTATTRQLMCMCHQRKCLLELFEQLLSLINISLHYASIRACLLLSRLISHPSRLLSIAGSVKLVLSRANFHASCKRPLPATICFLI